MQNAELVIWVPEIKFTEISLTIAVTAIDDLPAWIYHFEYLSK